MLKTAVNAAAAGHDLSGFKAVNAAESLPNGYEARCRKCGRTAGVGMDRLMYSLLDSECSPD
jgi:hypothetical protein